MTITPTLAPITAIFTIFELTYNHEIILPLMLACIPSIIVVRLFHGFSIYEPRLLMRGIRIVRGHDANRLRAMKIHAYICKDVPTMAAEMPFGEIMEQVLNSHYPHFIVNDTHGNLAGVLTLRDVRALLAQPGETDSSLTAEALMTKNVATVKENDSLEKAFHLFSNHSFSFLPVMSVQHPKQAIGCLKKDDLLTAYSQNILRDHCPPSSSLVCQLPQRK